MKKNSSFKGMGLTTLAVILLVTFNYINEHYDIKSFLEPSYSQVEKYKENDKEEDKKEEVKSYTMDNIPEYSGDDYVLIDGNVPSFTEEEKSKGEFEFYQDLDSLGRATLAFANIGKSLMPTEERGAIGMIKPSGWHTVKYDIVEGKYLYNRCHLIGFQLTGENANVNNLITCTRHMNTKGMLGFENKVTDYIKKTNNHVLYRVTPIYDGDNLLASGVLMEAESLEDGGEGISFKVFVFNHQDGIDIDYKTGESRLKEQ